MLFAFRYERASESRIIHAHEEAGSSLPAIFLAFLTSRNICRCSRYYARVCYAFSRSIRQPWLLLALCVYVCVCRCITPGFHFRDRQCRVPIGLFVVVVVVVVVVAVYVLRRPRLSTENLEILEKRCFHSAIALDTAVPMSDSSRRSPADRSIRPFTTRGTSKTLPLLGEQYLVLFIGQPNFF